MQSSSTRLAPNDRLLQWLADDLAISHVHDKVHGSPLSFEIYKHIAILALDRHILNRHQPSPLKDQIGRLEQQGALPSRAHQGKSGNSPAAQSVD